MSKKHNYSGIESLFPLLGGDPHCGYCFGMFTTEESPDCFFRLSFNTHSKLYASGIAPELVVVVDREVADKDTAERIVEERQYIFPGMQDYDDGKHSWFFPINNTQMQELADADCIKSILLVKNHNSVLDLYTSGQEIWSMFFRAGVAECINEEKDSWEFKDFCILYDSIKRGKMIEAAVIANSVQASDLLVVAIDPNGSLDTLLTKKADSIL